MTWHMRIGSAVLLSFLVGCGDDGDRSDHVPDWTAWACSANDAGAGSGDGGTLDATVLENDAGTSDRSCDPSATWVITLERRDGDTCVCDIGLDQSFEVEIEPCAGGHYASRMYVVKERDEGCGFAESKAGERGDQLVDVSADGCTVHYAYARPWTNSSEEGEIRYDVTWTSDGSNINASARVVGSGFCQERPRVSATVKRIVHAP